MEAKNTNQGQSDVDCGVTPTGWKRVIVLARDSCGGLLSISYPSLESVKNARVTFRGQVKEMGVRGIRTRIVKKGNLFVLFIRGTDPTQVLMEE